MHLDDVLHVVRGSIYYWTAYSFNEKEEDTRNKYWITLNCKVNDFPMNIVLPTSQVDKHYYNNPDNMRDTVVIEVNESEYFYKKTLIDLKTIIYERRATIEEAWDAGYLKYQGKLESHLFDRIENAIRNSIILSLVEKKEFLCEE